MDRQQYIQLRKKFNLDIKPGKVIFHYLQDAVLMTVGLGLFYGAGDSLTRFFAIPIFSILMFRNFSLMHDAVHSCISENKKINDSIGIISGAFSLLPFDQWKAIHLQHHYWSGNIEKDPVMALVRTFPQWTQSMRSAVSFFWRIWVPAVAFLQYGVFWFHCSLGFFRKPFTVKEVLSFLSPALLIVATSILAPSFAITILLPALYLYLVAVEVVNLPHHLGLPQYFGETKLPVWEQFKIARSCLYPRWVARFIALNFNYHIEHHMFPDAPWYYLDEIHTELKAQLQDQYNTDPQFEWILKNRPKDMEQLLIKDSQEYSQKQNNKAAS
jgi:fatty acid desaturase